MNYYYLTGSSKGIGKALAEHLLETESNYVVGISRTQSIQHERYEHIKLDLSAISEVSSFSFVPLIDADSVTLINNSGIIEPIDLIGKQDSASIHTNYLVNIVAPSILMNLFVAQYQNEPIQKTVLNVSSGAGRHAIASWSTYCATKSAMDMYSQVLHEEQKQQKSPIRVFSVAPGIVDTPMQDMIRAASSDQFSDVERFVSYKKNDQLASPQEVAKQLASIIINANKHTDVLLDVRTI